MALPSSVWSRQTKPGAAVGDGVDAVEGGDELGDQRVIDPRPQSPDVDLRQLPLHALIVPPIAPCGHADRPSPGLAGR